MSARQRRQQQEPLSDAQLRQARDVARGEAPFRLPPGISVKKVSFAEGHAYAFRHCSLGELGRVVLQDTPGGQTFIRCEVSGDSDDPVTAQRQALLEPLTNELCQRLARGMASTGRPVRPENPPPPASGGQWVESKLVLCHRCDVKVACLVFAEHGLDIGGLEDCARMMYGIYTRINLPTWIVGPTVRDPDGVERAFIVKVWPVREAAQRLTGADFDAVLSPLRHHCL